MNQPLLLWAMYFAQIKGMQYHPGNQSGLTQRLTTAECARIADEMMDETLTRVTACQFSPSSEQPQ